jgi:hypothetical protein
MNNISGEAAVPARSEKEFARPNSKKELIIVYNMTYFMLCA